MKALIDADIIIYRVGFTTEKEEEWVAAARIDSFIEDTLIETRSDDYKCYLTSSDKSNFRYALYSEYKAGRTKPKPVHYDFMREYILRVHPSELIYDMEADDALAIAQTKDTIICTIDKDLYQVPGFHYHFVNKILFSISVEEAKSNFYKQILMGDKGTDNIPGCPGIGKVYSERLIHPDMEEKDMVKVVVDSYITQYEKKGLENPIEDLVRNAQLLKLKTTLEEPLWQLPNFGT